LEALTKHIKDRLTTHKWCVAFESDLERVWPPEKMQRDKRDEAIQAFAKRNGWTATIRDPGIRVTFRKLS
jgi:hypothetical protein